MGTSALVFQIGNMLALSGWVVRVASPARQRLTPTVWKFTGRAIPLQQAVPCLLLTLMVGPADPLTLAALRPSQVLRTL